MSAFSVDSVGGVPRFGYGGTGGLGGEMNAHGHVLGFGHHAIGSSPLRPRSRSVSPTKGYRGDEVDMDDEETDEARSSYTAQADEEEGPAAVPFPSFLATHSHQQQQSQHLAQTSSFALSHKHSQSFDPSLSSSSLPPPVSFQKPSSIRRFTPPSSSPLAQKAISAPELLESPTPLISVSTAVSDNDSEEGEDDEGSLVSALDVPSSQLRARTPSLSRGDRDSGDTDSLIDLYDHTPPVSDTEPMPSLKESQSRSERTAGKRTGGSGGEAEAENVEDIGGTRGVEGGGQRVHHYSGRPLPLPPGMSADVPQTPLVVDLFRGIRDAKGRDLDDEHDEEDGKLEQKDPEENEVDLMSLDGEEFVTASSTLREQAQAVLERIKDDPAGQVEERSPFDDDEDDDEDDGGGTNSTIMATPLSTWKPLIPPPSPSPSPPRTPSHNFIFSHNHAGHEFGAQSPSSSPRPPLPLRPTLLSPQPSVSTIGSGASTPLPSTPGSLEGEVEEQFQLHYPPHLARPQHQHHFQSHARPLAPFSTNATSPTINTPSPRLLNETPPVGDTNAGVPQIERVSPSQRPYIDYTDLDVLISRLEEGNTRAGDNYDVSFVSIITTSHHVSLSAALPSLWFTEPTPRRRHHRSR